MNRHQFSTAVLKPTLHKIGLYSHEAERLLIGTAIQESRLKYIVQLGGGPALSYFQIEPDTIHDINENYLKFRPSLKEKADYFKVENISVEEQIVWNMALSVVYARLHYRRIPEKLPDADDLTGQARYWKRYYNTALGRGTEEEYIANYRREIE